MKIFKIILGLFLLVGMFLPSFAVPQEPRWNKNLLMVYLPKDNAYTEAMKNAFSEWQKALPRKIQFYFVSLERDKKLAEIDVNFNVVEGEDAENSGKTELQGVSYYRHGSIVINTLNKEEFAEDEELKAANDEQIYRIMLHEVGKVLGLPSSQNPRSVMFDEILEDQTILPEDINRISEKYGWVK